MGVTIEDIKRMQRLVEIFGRPKKPLGKKEIQVWKDVGIFKDLFPEDKSSVEILQELRKRDLG